MNSIKAPESTMDITNICVGITSNPTRVRLLLIKLRVIPEGRLPLYTIQDFSNQDSFMAPTPVCVIDGPRSRILVPSDDCKETIPAISGKDLFADPADAVVDTIFTEDVTFPRNSERQYSAPNMKLLWPDKAKTHQAFDKTLAKIQDRLAFITRPVD
ncbi:hypothetical protein BGZ99_006832 [Dissophora globulifera]|uniref:Uncharacterized protein n=1 Tax=Dissophora globulifera TaxID=979702 RepID=A0A9P6UQL8_9FUNG|nr:hypothetical protein BGZ99_006832 [Dissophora globulifera]